MTTKTVGFAIDQRDEARLERLVRKYGGGNRSAFLRSALDTMEAMDRAERLKELQRYGASLAAEGAPSYGDVDEIVHRVLRKAKRRT
jgi:Arc/MetJ-type ribon-helix-helix transcriptional regulator